MNKIILLLLFFTQISNAEVLTSRAYNKNNKLVYKERLSIQRAVNGKIIHIKTEYLDESDKVFATLESDFLKSSFIPNSKFSDSRFSLIENVTYYPDKKIIEVNRIISKKANDGIINLSSPFVMGQGFNNYISENFDKLLTEEVVIWFGIAPRIDKFRFRVSLVSKENNQSKVKFKIEPESFVLKAFVSPIILTYDLETKKLLEFQGLSNIDDSKGNSQEVIIRYDY